MSSIWNNIPLHGQQGTNHYKVLLKKENAWKTIAAALGGNVSGVLYTSMLHVVFTVEMCMKRWKALQELFAMEAKRVVMLQTIHHLGHTMIYSFF